MTNDTSDPYAPLTGYPRLDLVLAWTLMLLMGPLLLEGEWVGPMGHVNWRMIFTGMAGTLLWAAIILEVIRLV